MLTMEQNNIDEELTDKNKNILITNNCVLYFFFFLNNIHIIYKMIWKFSYYKIKCVNIDSTENLMLSHINAIF